MNAELERQIELSIADLRTLKRDDEPDTWRSIVTRTANRLDTALYSARFIEDGEFRS